MTQFAESEPASRSEQDLSSAGEFNEVLRAMAAHDLRQPLQVILSAFAWLERHRLMGREQQYVELGELAARRLREQLDHLADAVGLHHRKRGALLSPVKLAPLLDALHQENADLARERGLTVRICPTRTVIMSDPTLLHSILCNLIRNAIKYAPKGGRILVGCRGSGPNARIEVQILVLSYRPIICRKSSMRFIAWIRLNPMAWVSDYSWFGSARPSRRGPIRSRARIMFFDLGRNRTGSK